MLFIFNKAKIISYIISIFTVVALFVFANNLDFKANSTLVMAKPTQIENEVK